MYESDMRRLRCHNGKFQAEHVHALSEPQGSDASYEHLTHLCLLRMLKRKCVSGGCIGCAISLHC